MLTNIIRRETIEQVVIVEEEKSDNIHDATRIVLRKSSANNGKPSMTHTLTSTSCDCRHSYNYLAV